MLPPKRCTRSSISRSTAVKRHAETVDFSWNSPSIDTSTSPSSKARPKAVVEVKSRDEGLQIQISTDEKIPKKPRRKLTTEQQDLLEREAVHEKYPSLERRRELADHLGLNLKVISVWFQNKRRPSTKSLASTPYRAPRPTAKMVGVLTLGHDDEQMVNSTTPAGRMIFMPIDASNKAELESTPIWSYLPSSPQEADSDPSYAAVSAHGSRLLDTVPHGSLEWACQKESAQHAFLHKKSITSTLDTTTQSRRCNVKPSMVPGPQTQISTRLYDRDEFEVAFTLVRMRNGTTACYNDSV